MVTTYELEATVEAAVNVSVLVPAPGAAMLVGEKLAVMPVGIPLADKAIAELRPFVTAVVRVTVPVVPPANT
jgi:hypothetical protein